VPVLTPSLLFDLAQEVLDCVCCALQEESPCPCPCQTCVIVGPPSWDDCCVGQLTVGVDRVFVHDNFPSAAAGPVFCASPLAGDFTVTLLRCAPTVNQDGTTPACAELSDSASKIYTEMYIAVRAVICCLAAKKRSLKFIMRDSTIVGPEGGCVGFQIKFTAELPDPLP
jgi:hypothetical protein